MMQIKRNGRVTRRQFIEAASVAAVGASSLGSSALAGTRASAASRLTASKFSGQLHSPFSVVPLSRESPAVSLILVAVTPAASAHPSLTREQAREMSFSIMLSAPPSSPLRGLVQDTYAISHPVLGEFAALLVPGRDGDSLTGVFHYLA